MNLSNLNVSEPYAIVGTFVHSESPDRIEILNNHALVVSNGKIEYLGPATEKWDKKYIISKSQVLKMDSKQFVMPGFIDTHIHAPQYPNAGLGYDETLLEWLQKYTFPLESQYGDANFANNVYEHVVRHSLDCGTTTACYFATIHWKTSLSLVNVMKRFGQRGFVGKVNMNICPYEGYIEELDQSLVDTEAFIENVLEQESKLVLPIITPRFALSCNSLLMEKLGELARKYDVHIQTHISETCGEIEAVKENFPDVKYYAEVYDKANLLTKKTVLAHGVWLEDEELELLALRGSSVAHCPCSNNNLQSGLCNVRRLLNKGIKVGLGTDVSGGHSPSILDVMHSALDTSIHSYFQNNNFKPLNYHEVFYLATLGGARALSLDDQVGNFKPDKRFDALVIDLSSCGHLFDISPENLVQKFVYTGDDRNIIGVFVDGKIVKS